MSEWHECKTVSCLTMLKEKNTHFPYCPNCNMKRFRAMDFPHKSGPHSVSFSVNELDGLPHLKNAFRKV